MTDGSGLGIHYKASYRDLDGWFTCSCSHYAKTKDDQTQQLSLLVIGRRVSSPMGTIRGLSVLI